MLFVHVHPLPVQWFSSWFIFPASDLASLIVRSVAEIAPNTSAKIIVAPKLLSSLVKRAKTANKIAKTPVNSISAFFTLWSFSFSNEQVDFRPSRMFCNGNFPAFCWLDRRSDPHYGLLKEIPFNQLDEVSWFLHG